jgi:hypothetical protein
MRYLCLLHIAEDSEAPRGTPDWQAVVAANVTAREAMAKAGVLVDCAPLQPVRAATTVRVRDGETLLTDGPFAELKEQLGGYYVLECADLDEALRWAAAMPAAGAGAVEVRPLMPVPGSLHAEQSR